MTRDTKYKLNGELKSISFCTFLGKNKSVFTVVALISALQTFIVMHLDETIKTVITSLIHISAEHVMKMFPIKHKTLKCKYSLADLENKEAH